jgi:hypothetical protein
MVLMVMVVVFGLGSSLWQFLLVSVTLVLQRLRASEWAVNHSSDVNNT